MRLNFSYAPVYIEDGHRRPPRNPNSLYGSASFDWGHNLLGLILDALHLASAAVGDSILTTAHFCQLSIPNWLEWNHALQKT